MTFIDGLPSISSVCCFFFFFFSSRRRHTRFDCDWSSDVCSSDLVLTVRRTARIDTLVLDLLSLRVDSVLVGERATRFRRDSGTIRIPLPAASSDTLTIAVRYGGPVTDGLIMRSDTAWGWTAFADKIGRAHV